MSIDEQLEKFRVNFPLTKVTVYDLFMTYKVRSGLADSVAQEANELIETLGLELTAIPSRLSSADSICVQSQYVQL